MDFLLSLSPRYVAAMTSLWTPSTSFHFTLALVSMTSTTWTLWGTTLPPSPGGTSCSVLTASTTNTCKNTRARRCSETHLLYLHTHIQTYLPTVPTYIHTYTPTYCTYIQTHTPTYCTYTHTHTHLPTVCTYRLHTWETNKHTVSIVGAAVFQVLLWISLSASEEQRLSLHHRHMHTHTHFYTANTNWAVDCITSGGQGQRGSVSELTCVPFLKRKVYFGGFL